MKFLTSPRNTTQSIFTFFALKLVFTWLFKIVFGIRIRMQFPMSTLKGCLRFSFEPNMLPVVRV